MGQKPSAAFALSLLGGILVLAGVAFLAFGFGPWLFIFLVITPLFLYFVSGPIIIIGAAFVYGEPTSARAWGIVVLIFGVVSLFGVVTTLGGIFSMIGGVLAVTWKPSGGPSSDDPPYDVRLTLD